MEPIRIIVAWDAACLSPNRRIHPAVRRELARDARLAALSAYREAGFPVALGPVRVSLTVRRGRTMDADNVLAAIKPLIDQLFNSRLNGEGVTPSDSPLWLEWGTIRGQIGKEWKGREEVEFIIEARE